jgi:hypothetical protein
MAKTRGAVSDSNGSGGLGVDHAETNGKIVADIKDSQR